MKKILMLLVAMALVMSTSLMAQAANMTWSAVTTYTDGTTIPTADIARIVYTPYYGSSATGPWTTGTPTAAGATSATLSDPSTGQTRWYTVDALLDGQRSAKGVAASKTVPFKLPGAPSGITVQ